MSDLAQMMFGLSVSHATSACASPCCYLGCPSGTGAVRTDLPCAWTILRPRDIFRALSTRWDSHQEAGRLLRSVSGDRAADGLRAESNSRGWTLRGQCFTVCVRKTTL